MKRRTRKSASYAAFISRGRFLFVAAVLCTVFAAVFCRLYVLHIVKEKWSEQIISKARNRFDKIDARRGDIVDSRGNLLATSRPVIELGVDPERMENTPEEREALQKLAAIIEMPYPELLKKCESETLVYEDEDGTQMRKVRWRKIAENIDDPTYERIRGLKIKAIYGNRKYVRVYPAGALTSHAVGFVNKEFVAQMGAEKKCDYYLRGQDGWRETERDGRRREAAQFRTREVEPKDGMNVEMTIDIIIQEMAQRELKDIVEKYDPDSATIIVGEPSTGYLLAMASYPNFDPNNYNKYPQDALRNRAICDQFEPGSTFKCVPVAAALNESIVGENDSFDCKSSSISYKGRILRLPKDSHPHDHLTVREITQKSSNRGVAQLAVLMGENMLYKYARAFGYGSKTGIGLAGEINGTLHEVKDWDGLTITRLPMGHAVAATPIQVHCAMSTIANQGIYMRPQIIKRVYDAESSINFPPVAERRVISIKTATLLGDILCDVVGEGGTARRAEIPGYRVAGKTGTSQKIINGRYSNTKHVGSMTGFFPAQRPRVVITVVVDNPKMKGIGYGGVVAAPVFSRIGAQVANYLGIQTDGDFEKMIAWRQSR